MPKQVVNLFKQSNFILFTLIALGFSQFTDAKPQNTGKNKTDNTQPITILEQPVSTSVEQGASASFSVIATVKKGPNLKYQWFFNNQALPDATNSTYTLAESTMENAGNYHVELRSGDRFLSSSLATLSVEGATIINNAPIAHNDSASTKENTTVIIDVLANDSDPEGQTLNIVSASANIGTLSINNNGTLSYNPAPDYHGTDTIYYAISDSEGARSEAQVTITIDAIEDLRITYHPSSSTIYTGASHTLNVSAVGEGAIGYQWFKDGLEIEHANQSFLSISDASSTDAGIYEVLVSDNLTSTLSNPVVIDVETQSGIGLNWETPSQREDGSLLDQSEISYFNIYSLENSTNNQQVLSVPAYYNNYTIENLNPGEYTFWITTVDMSGLEGASSGTVSVTF